MEPRYPAVDVTQEADWVVAPRGGAERALALLSKATTREAGIAYCIGFLQKTIDKGIGICPACLDGWHYSDICPDLDEPEGTSPFVLYRLLDVHGRVLYVGVTRNFSERMRAHRRNWGSLIADVITEQYPTAEMMLEAEALAIHDEQPPLNAAGIG